MKNSNVGPESLLSSLALSIESRVAQNSVVIRTSPSNVGIEEPYLRINNDLHDHTIHCHYGLINAQCSPLLASPSQMQSIVRPQQLGKPRSSLNFLAIVANGLHGIAMLKQKETRFLDTVERPQPKCLETSICHIPEANLKMAIWQPSSQ